ncbi:hypothetical protein KDA11_04725 [Candidatus Saccharibacteria bacterium]|nr:hypothetical protein [Candidatus Saccharibacteria bacterium]
MMEPGKLRVVSKSGFTETQEQLDSYSSAGEYVLEKIKEMIARKERVLVLESATGSGKSTYLMNQIRKNAGSLFPEAKEKYILVTQPRVLTAMEIPSGMARDTTNYPDLVLGRNIGFATGAFKNPSLRGGLLYSTVGVPLIQMQTNPDGFIRDRYGFIVVDEAHEQDTELIVFLYMLRGFIERNKSRADCPFVIVMSATLDVYKFAHYLQTNKIISVKGLTYPINPHYPESGYDDYLLGAAEKVMELAAHREDDPIERDILVFLPGEGEMRKVADMIKTRDTKGELAVVKITGTGVRSNSKDVQIMTEMPLEDIRKYLKMPNINRRVGLATNVAETGITIDTLKYVIDSGWSRAPEYNSIHDLTMIISKGAAQSSIKQRQGRVGRKFIGEYYPLYTEQTRNALPKYALEPIYSTVIDMTLLYLFDYQEAKAQEVKMPKNWKVDIPETIDPLATEAVIRSVEKLRILGMLQEDTYILTRLGKMALAVPRLKIEQIRCILMSYIFGISLTDIVGIMLFMKIKLMDVLEDRKKPQFRITTLLGALGLEIDAQFVNAIMADEFLRWWFVIEYYRQRIVKHGTKLSKVRDDMEKMGIHFDGFVTILSDRRTILESMDAFGMKDVHKPLTIEDFNRDLTNTIARFKGCFYEGFKLNYATLTEEGNYVTRTGMRFDHFIYLGTEEKPKTILFDSLTARNVTKGGNYNYEISVGQISVLDGYLAICI